MTTMTSGFGAPDWGDSVLRSLEGQRNLPRWFPAVFAVVSRLRIGAIEVQLPDGRVFRAEGPEPGPEGRVIVHDERVFGRMMTQGAMGFAEAYLEGWISSDSLQEILDVGILNNEAVARGFAQRKLMMALERFRHWLNRNTRRQARKNIEAHYDLGNEFYALWLDPSMTYSSALFAQPEQDLEEAQRNKYRSICDRMALKQGDHVLEIGCGWGGFAEYAARERGAKVTGLTLSPSQLEFARERVFKAGLAERVELVLRDYRDERGRYDGIASIEMFEAVGEKYWPAYFQTLHDRLKPGARASLQIITIRNELFQRYRSGVDFIQKYVFPGGMLPSPEKLQEQSAAAGLQWVDSIEFGEDYSQTLRIWRDRFHRVWGEIERLPTEQPFNERFKRLWTFYLAVCAATFRAGTTDVTQVALRRA